MTLLNHRMNGFALLSAVRGAPELKHLPFLPVTAAARRDDIELVAQQCASDYIVKTDTWGR